MPLQRVMALPNLLIQANRCSTVLCSKTKYQLSFNKTVTVNRWKHSKVFKTEKDKIQTFVVQRYMQYVKNYTNVLESRFPAAVKMYRVFSVGIREFLADLKRYISLRVQISRDRGFSNMSSQDIELYLKMPSDMYRIAPVLLLSAIPFGNYIIFPLAFLNPRRLLCSHFWSLQQRVEFGTQEMTERLRHNKPVFRALQAKVHAIPAGDVKTKWKRVVALLGSGAQPSAADLLECQELFSQEPYHLAGLTYAHKGHLLKMHGMRSGAWRLRRLERRARLLRELDRAVAREGGAAALSAAALGAACALRGLHARHVPAAERRAFLRAWLALSAQLPPRAASLLLHAPLLLAYNHPQNWVLIY